MQLYKNIAPEFVDIRGGITRILDGTNVAVKSILLITSKKGSIRANHYHKKDTHYCYLVSGSMEYYEAPLAAFEAGEKDKIEKVVVRAGDMVFTPSMNVHAMKFLEDTVFFAFATESRDQADYEADTVRVDFVK